MSEHIMGKIVFGPATAGGADHLREPGFTVEHPPVRRPGNSRLVVRDGAVVVQRTSLYDDEFIGGTSRFAAVQDEA